MGGTGVRSRLLYLFPGYVGRLRDLFIDHMWMGHRDPTVSNTSAALNIDM